VQLASVGRKVVGTAVDGAVLVPHGDVTRPPAAAEGDRRIGERLQQSRQQSVAAGPRQPEHITGEPRVDEEQLVARTGMDGHDGVATAGTEVTIEYFGERYGAIVAEEPLYDPNHVKLRG